MLPEKLTQFLTDFQAMDDREMRSMVLIDYADKFTEVPERIARRPFDEQHKIPYCESEGYVWIEELPQQRVKLHFAVENPSGISAKALAAILDETLSGEPAEVVARVDPEMIYTLFGKNITMGKGQGLMAMVTMVKSLSQKFSDTTQ